MPQAVLSKCTCLKAQGKPIKPNIEAMLRTGRAQLDWLARSEVTGRPSVTGLPGGVEPHHGAPPGDQVERQRKVLVFPICVDEQ